MPEILSLKTYDKLLSAPPTKILGERGEKLAADFLRKNGYRLVMANFTVAVGRNRLGVSISGEIDLIALDEDVLCFVEVKTRSSDDFASPLAAVTLQKQRQITRTARAYRKIYRIYNVRFRYDVVSIVLPQNDKPQIEIVKNFWNESKFSKKVWVDDFRF